MEEQKKIVEINGIKLEIDLREAKTIESYKVGDNVRLLEKDYGDNYKVQPGVIIGFDAFEKLPTITVCYLKISYNDVEVKFAYINEQNTDYELAPAYDIEELRFKKGDVLNKIDKEIVAKQEEIKDMEVKREYFLSNFNQYFRQEKDEKISS